MLKLELLNNDHKLIIAALETQVKELVKKDKGYRKLFKKYYEENNEDKAEKVARKLDDNLTILDETLQLLEFLNDDYLLNK